MHRIPRNGLALAMALALALAPARAEEKTLAAWEGYELHQSASGEIVIRPDKPNPPGDPPVACLKILRRTIAKYAEEEQAQRQTPTTARDKDKERTRRAWHAFRFIDALAIAEVVTSAKFPGRPNAFRPHREALAKVLRVRSQVEVKNNKGEFEARTFGGRPGARELAEFDAYTAKLTQSLKQLDGQIASREKDASEEEAAAPPPAPTGGPRPAAEPLPPSPSWVAEKGRQVYRPSGPNPAGDAPLPCLESLRHAIVTFDLEDTIARKKYESEPGNRGLLAERILSSHKNRAITFFKNIAYLEAYQTLENDPRAHNPFRPVREELEATFGVRSTVEYDGQFTVALTKKGGDDDPYRHQMAKFDAYMARLLQSAPKMKEDIDRRRKSGEGEPEP